MTQPTAQQRAISVRNAKDAAHAVLQAQRDNLLKFLFNSAQLKVVDKWIATNDPTLDRSEAIRRLFELGLKAKQ
ncbi:MAG: hypothetical protein ACJ8EL_13760 [Rhizomicrobium sp.]|jgi:hypothetical protein